MNIKVICLFLIVGLISVVGNAECSTVDVYEAPAPDGYTPWNNPGNIATYNAWLAAIGETPDFREDWDGLDWTGNPWVDNKLFDIQNVPGAIFTDGVTFGNIGSDSDRRARSQDSIGSTDAIDLYGWRADMTGVSTINFSTNKADYLGFYIFDTDHGPGTDIFYTITFSDNTTFSYNALATEEDRWRFIGFVNRNPNAFFSKFEITAPTASQYGIDELEWGREPVIPEPATVVLFGVGGIVTAWIKRRRCKQ